MTKLIGYLISCGTFTTKDGSEINYSNRVLRCITDTASDENNIGLAAFEVKLKSSMIADCLKCPDTNVDVNAALNQLLNKPVRFVYAPVNGALTVSGVYPDNEQKGGH